jgi:hypothetical protein
MLGRPAAVVPWVRGVGAVAVLLELGGWLIYVAASLLRALYLVGRTVYRVAVLVHWRRKGWWPPPRP